MENKACLTAAERMRKGRQNKQDDVRGTATIQSQRKHKKKRDLHKAERKNITRRFVQLSKKQCNEKGREEERNL